MPVFSNPIFIRIVIAIGITIWWVGTCWIAHIYGYRRGYTNCLNNMRAKRQARRKPARKGDIRVLNPVEPRKRYAEAESVRIVATHTTRPKEEDAWM